MKINHEIIRCPDGTYAIWQGDTLVSEGWRTVEDARLHAAAVALGRKGGQATSEAKTEAARVNAKRGGRPRKQTDDFEYAVQIQPRNGQQLVEYREGLTLTYRDWNNADRKRHPQAERQLWDGACLVVDLDTDNVYAVEKP